MSERGPRERMVLSAAQLIRRDGVTATGLRDVVTHAGAPRGSLQHYFPGGKEQLVGEAVALAGRFAAGGVARLLDGLPEPSPGRLFAAMVRQWTDRFETAGYGGGCTIAAATVDRARAGDAARAAAAEAFALWVRQVAAALTELGVPEERAGALASLMVSTLEGAILVCRAAEDTAALHTAALELGPLLDASAG